jgi:hypothetical protein
MSAEELKISGDVLVIKIKEQRFFPKMLSRAFYIHLYTFTWAQCL